ncbi:MAG: thioredoxin family protein [Planctomycetia bacterium]|nr:thioredoxin family protein [Planctomycetia bacterium]
MSERTDLDRLYDLAAGRLDDAERAALEERLAAEPELAAVWSDLDAVLRAGEEPVPPCDVPFERLTLTDAPTPASWRRGIPLAAAAAVLLVAGVWSFSRAARPVRPEGPVCPEAPVRLEAIAMAAGDLPAAADGAFAGVGLPAAALGYAPAGPRGLRFLDGLAEGRQLAAASGRPLVVFLFEPSCPLCQQLAATTFRDPGLAAAADPFVLARVRASGEGAELFKTHAVGWPVFVLYGVDGQEVATFGGAPDVAKLRDALVKVAGPDLAPVPWPTVRATARALRVAEIARDAHERDDALERARTLAVDAPLAAAVAAATRAASAPAARALREARDLAASGALDAARARLDAALVVERGGRFERELAAVRARLVADGAFPALEEVR